MLAHALERGCGAALRLERQWQGHLCECRERRDVARLQFVPLKARDAGHQRQVVVRSPLLTADARPWADVAVVHRLWVIRGRKDVVVLTDRLLKPPADQAKVSGVVVHPILVNGRGCVWRDHIETLGRAALNARQHLAVEPKLKNGPTTRFARELRIGDLVCPGAEGTGGISPQQNVWTAVPISILERGLDDSVSSCAHGIHRARDRLGSVPKLCEIHDAPTGVFKSLDVLVLVLQAAREERFKDRIVEVGTGPFAIRLAELQCRTVSAVQEVGEVRRRKNNLV